MRPTGNCRPALLLLETAFLADFPFPRPDMVAQALVARKLDLTGYREASVRVWEEKKADMVSWKTRGALGQSEATKPHGRRGL